MEYKYESIENSSQMPIKIFTRPYNSPDKKNL